MYLDKCVLKESSISRESVISQLEGVISRVSSDGRFLRHNVLQVPLLLLVYCVYVAICSLEALTLSSES